MHNTSTNNIYGLNCMCYLHVSYDYDMYLYQTILEPCFKHNHAFKQVYSSVCVYENSFQTKLIIKNCHQIVDMVCRKKQKPRFEILANTDNICHIYRIEF